MDDRIDPVLLDETLDQRLIAAVADDERHARGNGPVESGGKVVEHDDALAGIDEVEHHVATDIAGSAGDEDRHAVTRFLKRHGHTPIS